MDPRNIIVLSGEDLSLRDVQKAFGCAWFGSKHPTTIQAERRTLDVLLSVLPWNVTESRPFKWNGAFLIENPAIPEGEIVFDVRERPEQNSMITGFKVVDVHAWWQKQVDPAMVGMLTIQLSEEAWNELWNALSPLERFPDDSEKEFTSLLLRSPHGRRISIQQLRPAIKAVS